MCVCGHFIVCIFQGTRYVLPDWMSYDHYAERIQGIAKGEGCTVEELTGYVLAQGIIVIVNSIIWLTRCSM